MSCIIFAALACITSFRWVLSILSSLCPPFPRTSAHDKPLKHQGHQWKPCEHFESKPGHLGEKYKRYPNAMPPPSLGFYSDKPEKVAVMQCLLRSVTPNKFIFFSPREIVITVSVMLQSTDSSHSDERLLIPIKNFFLMKMQLGSSYTSVALFNQIVSH